MYFFKHRPFLCASILFFLSLFVTIRLPLAWQVTLLCTVFGATIAALVLYLRRHALLPVFFSVFCLVACLSSVLYTLPARKLTPHLGTQAQVVLTVTDITYQDKTFVSAVGELSEINGEKVKGRVQLQLYGETVELGDELSAKARFATFDEDIASYAASRGYRAHLTLSEVQKTGENFSLPIHFSRWRARLADRIAERVPGESGPLLSAVLLGERDALSEGFRRDMQRIGTAHMLALSGLHVGILLLGLERLLSLLRVDKRLRYGILLLLVLGYLALTGFSVSTVRSGVMLIIGIIGFFFASSVEDSATVLSYATLGICLIQPYSVMDISLWLSAGATFGILLYHERTTLRAGMTIRERQKRVSRVPKWLRPVLSSLGITLSATIITLPITIVTFGEVALLTPISNLLFSLLIQAEIYLAVCVLLFGGIPLVCTVADLCSKTMMWLASALSSLSGAVLSTAAPFVTVLCLLVFLLITAYFLSVRPERFRMRVPLCILLSAALLVGGFCGISTLAHKNTLSVTYLTYEEGQSDFLLLEDGRHSAVIDCSGGTRAAFQRANAVMQKQGVTTIDHYILTSYHTNTENTICRALSSEIIKNIYLPEPTNDTQSATAAAIAQAAERNRTAVIYYPTAATFRFDDCTLTLHPDYSMQEGTLAFSLYYGQEQILYLSEGAVDYGSEGYLSRFARLSRAVLFGASGPAYRVTIPISAEEFAAVPLICGTGARLPFEEKDGCVLTEQYRITLHKP